MRLWVFLFATMSFIGKKGSDRSLISFNKEIIEAVLEKTEGKYTRGQVMDVFFASILYIHSLMRYTDTLVISVPWLGDVVCNLKEMKSRHLYLTRRKEKFGYLPPHMEEEVIMLEKKIAVLEEMKEDGAFKNGNDYIKSVRRSIEKFRKGLTFDEIENLQNKEFYNG